MNKHIKNQTRRAVNLEDTQIYDTDLAVKAAIEGMANLIRKDKRD